MCNLSYFIYLYVNARARTRMYAPKAPPPQTGSISFPLAICPEICRGFAPLDPNSFGLISISILARLYARSTKEAAMRKIDLCKAHKDKTQKIFSFFLKIVHFEVDFNIQSMLSYGRRQERDTEDGGQAR